MLLNVIPFNRSDCICEPTGGFDAPWKVNVNHYHHILPCCCTAPGHQEQVWMSLPCTGEVDLWRNSAIFRVGWVPLFSLSFDEFFPQGFRGDKSEVFGDLFQAYIQIIELFYGWQYADSWLFKKIWFSFSFVFCRDLADLKNPVSTLLMKHARGSTVNGIKYYSGRYAKWYQDGNVCIFWYQTPPALCWEFTEEMELHPSCVSKGT